MSVISDRNDGLILGSHLSIGKGFAAAVDEAERLGSNALQIFSHNASAWRMKPITPEAAAAFRQRVEESALRFGVIHTMYLLNLATPDDELYERSIDALEHEIDRAGRLGVHSLVTHLGAHKGSGMSEGIDRVATALNRVMQSVFFRDAAEVRLLLENTAGTGSTVGGPFEELAGILGGLSDSRRVGVCLDTCHAFAAGYDLRTKEAVDETISAFEEAIGLKHLEMIHLNDSRFPLASRRDRHEHLGRGEIGLEGMAAIVNHPALRRLPFILETPKEIDGQDGADEVNLELVRGLQGKGEET